MLRQYLLGHLIPKSVFFSLQLYNSKLPVTIIIVIIICTWRQHTTKQKLDGHLPAITKTIKIRRTRHAEHCWRSRDELISDILLWTPSHGRAKAGRSARTYIQQLCADAGCSLEDLPEAIDDREGAREVQGYPC